MEILYSIIEEKTGKLLYSQFGNKCNKGQVAIEELLTEAIEESDVWYFDFQTRQFYKK